MLKAHSRFIVLLIAALLSISCNQSKDDVVSAPILTSPGDGDHYTTRESVTISAEVLENSNVESMEFWISNSDSTQVIYTGESAPFTFSTKLKEGTYSLWAKSNFHSGEELESEKISITVEADINDAFIHISSPTEGDIFNLGEAIEVNVTALDVDGIERLDLWIDDALFSSDSTSPYTFSVEGLAEGHHSLKLTMVDILGNSTDSEEITFSVEDIDADYSTIYDGGIIIPERETATLYIFKGGTSAAERDWNNSSNILWQMPLKNANGVAAEDLAEYNSLWTSGGTAINDVKRVVHNGINHVVITGNKGDALAMYEFETKKCIYWGGTTANGPHDIDYAPVGSGYLLVANPASNAVLEVYDITSNNQGRAFSVEHKGVHSVHWDAKQELVWAWGSGQDGLKSYKLEVQDGKPVLTNMKEYVVSVANYEVGMAHGGSPMLKDGRRYLILAAKDGILRFDTESHAWNIQRWAEKDETGEATGIFRGCKGISYNDLTEEIIIGKAKDRIYSEDDNIGIRLLDNSEMYKARWWLHNAFSCE